MSKKETSQNIKPTGNAEIPLNCNDFVSNFTFPRYISEKKGGGVKSNNGSWSYQGLNQAGYRKVAERVCGCSIVSNFEQVSTLAAPL